MIINAYFIDGDFQGHNGDFLYSPIIKMVKTESSSTDYFQKTINKFDFFPKVTDYKVCFISFDKKTVLYSENGETNDLLKLLHSFIYFKQKNL